MGFAPQLLKLYRTVFLSAIEYRCHVFRLKDTQREFNQLERLLNKNLRTALGFRQSIPINVLKVEIKEAPLDLKFSFLLSRFMMPVTEADPSLQ